MTSLKDMGLIAESFFGSRSNEYAAGLSAGVYQKTTELQSKVLKAVNKAGQAIGPVAGKALVAELAAGASAKSPDETALDALEHRIFGINLTRTEKLVFGVIFAVIALVGYGYLRTR